MAARLWADVSADGARAGDLLPSERALATRYKASRVTLRARSPVAAWRGNRRGWAQKYLMERLAKAGGDVDAVTAVHAANFSPNGQVIAYELDARRPDEVLSRADRGIQDARGLAALNTALVGYLCNRCTQAGRLSDAVALSRDRFGARRIQLAYRQLRAAARPPTAGRPSVKGPLALWRADAVRRRRDWCDGPALIIQV